MQHLTPDGGFNLMFSVQNVAFPMKVYGAHFWVFRLQSNPLPLPALLCFMY